MDKSKKQGYILGSLIVVMLLVYGRNLISSSSSEESDVSDPVIQDEKEETALSLQGSLLIYPISDKEIADTRAKQHQRMDSIVWSRDPFMFGSANASLSGLSLSGIMWDPVNPVAIVNGQLVHVGDQVESYSIVAITQDEVSVTDGIETFKLNTAP